MGLSIRAILTAPVGRSEQHRTGDIGGDAGSGAPDQSIQPEDEHGIAYAVAALLAPIA